MLPGSRALPTGGELIDQYPTPRAAPSEQLLQRLKALPGQPGEAYSFRVLNGDVASAIERLADSIGAPMVIVGAGLELSHGSPGIWKDGLPRP